MKKPKKIKNMQRRREEQLGEITETNSLVYLRNRYYNPNLGVFPSLDPVLGNASYPMSLNRYSYVQNNPTNLTDPSGLCPIWDVDCIKKGLGEGLAYIAGGLNDATEGAQALVGLAGYGTGEGLALFADEVWNPIFVDSEWSQYIRGHEQEALLVAGISLTIAVFVVNPVAGFGVGSNLIGGAINRRYTGPVTEQNVSRLLTDALLGGMGGHFLGKVPLLQNASIVERAIYAGTINALQGGATDLVDDQIYHDPNAPQDIEDYVTARVSDFVWAAIFSATLDGSLKIVSGQVVPRTTSFGRIDSTLFEGNVLRETTRQANTLPWRSATLITNTNVSIPAIEYVCNLYVEYENQYCIPLP